MRSREKLAQSIPRQSKGMKLIDECMVRSVKLLGLGFVHKLILSCLPMEITASRHKPTCFLTSSVLNIMQKSLA